MNTTRILYLSKSVKPHFNLAFENWLIQDCHVNSNSPDCLFIYRNLPSIIIGRNQNVWAECNVKEAKSLGIPILRRYSGGGTVYHDLGNVNYSLNRDKSVFNRTFAAEMIIRSLKEHEPNLFLSPRHDIFLKDAKVSGSAYKLSRDRAYHHGTLLLSTNLSKISGLLKSPLNLITNHVDFKFGGVSSVPSPVTNINLGFDEFIQMIQKEFDPSQIVNITELDRNDAISRYENVLGSWDWVFGKSPPFKLELNGSVLVIESGIIKEVNSGDPNLIGKRLECYL